MIISNIIKIMPIRGVKIVKAAKPKAGMSATNICSPPYALDEMQSEDKTP